MAVNAMLEVKDAKIMDSKDLDRVKAELEIMQEDIVNYIQYELQFSLENSNISVGEISLIIEKDKCRMSTIKNPAMIEANIAKHYKDLPKMIEKYRDKEAEINKFEQEHPSYIKKLIEAGLLYPDGKRVITKLDDVASYLRDEKIMLPQRFLEETFLKPDGTKYSRSAIKKALEVANN